MNVFFVSLGCDKNLVDSEYMLGLLKEEGMTLVEEENLADVIVVNTCCFIHDAKEESIETLLSLAECKKTGQCKALIAAGCLAERYSKEILEQMPEVDGIVGTTAFDKLIPVIHEVMQGKTEVALEDINALPNLNVKRVITSGGFTSYLKIAEGCNKHCTYCIIPKVRGDYRSIPMERLIEEAKYLAEQGTRELILVAQETTLYGVDLYGEKKLPKLIQELCKIPELHWIRILYCYPEEITEELILTIKKEPKVCHYLDLPIQHASDTILKRMGRKTNEKELRTIIGRLREEIPDIALRTTLITGFPGETEEDVEHLCRFVKEMKFDRLGVFPYSPEEGTVAEKMEDQIPEKVKEERRDRIMLLQQGISKEKGESFLGKRMEVFLEGSLPQEEVLLARSYRDAPKVDGYVFVRAPGEYPSGSFGYVRIVGAKEYDLMGEWEEEE